jgi:hypothetical protein
VWLIVSAAVAAVLTCDALLMLFLAVFFVVSRAGFTVLRRLYQ